jgi:capsular polysaccharide biosynthesis protein
VAVPWENPSFPYRPRDTASVRTVDNALLSRVRLGRLRTWERPDRWITGAVYDHRRQLVVESQKVGGLGGDREVMADPQRFHLKRGVEVLKGTWLYGGHWFSRLGRFLTETVTTLWPTGLDVRGLVFHLYVDQHSGQVADWQARLVELAGRGGLPVRIVDKEPLGVERLVVPSRSLVLNGWAHQECLDVWRRIGDGVPAMGSWPSRVYLSRTSPEGDPTLAAALEASGFTMVEPDTLSVDDQVRLGRSADVLVGRAGTALHLAAFARPGTGVIALGNEQSYDRHPPTQQVINTLCGHRQAYIPPTVDPEQVRAHLIGLGVA